MSKKMIRFENGLYEIKSYIDQGCVMEDWIFIRELTQEEKDMCPKRIERKIKAEIERQKWLEEKAFWENNKMIAGGK